MPIGAFKLNGIGRYLAPTGRTAKTIVTEGTAAVSTAQSKFGGASALVGSAGTNLNGIYVAGAGCTDIRDWTTYTGFTVECWVRHTSFNYVDDGGFPSMIGIMERSDYPLTWSFGADRNGAIGFHYYNGSYISIKSANAQVTTNTWYHMAAVKNGSTVKVYLNGVEKASATISGTPQLITRPLSIGSYYRVGALAYIDEIRISKVARYTAAFTPSASAFSNDTDTLFLCHADGANGSTTFTDSTT